MERNGLKINVNWDLVVIDELGKKIVGEIKSREAIFLNALGRLVRNSEKSSFNVLVHSGSSAGKDYIIKNVLSIFPSAKIISRTRLSPTVLNYWEPWAKFELKPASWDEKVLYVSDVSDEFLNCPALKLMCSDGSYVTITNKKVIGNVEDLEIKGKPVIILTTANSTPNNEILGRFGVLSLDESDKQTERIHNFIPEDYSKNVLDFIARLKPCRVKITPDMRRKIASVFPKKLLRERRNFNRFLDYIKAVSVFYQADKNEYKEKSPCQSITSDWSDYDVAKDIFMNLYSGIVPLNTRQKEMVDIISASSIPLEVSDIHNRLKHHIEIQNLRTHLKSLTNIGILDKISSENHFNRFVQKYTISEEFKDNKPIKLPNSEEIR